MSASCITVILAAGASTRMKSPLSKLLHPLLGRPVIEWALQLARVVGNEVVVVVGHQREEVERIVREKAPAGLRLRFAHQKEAKGTADAVRAALAELSDEPDPTRPVFITGGDSVLLSAETLMSFCKQAAETRSVFSLMTTRLPSAGAYGRIVRNSHGVLEKIVEAKEASPQELEINEVNAGFYWVTLQALREGMSEISNRNRTREFYLTDLVATGRQKGWLMSSLLIPPEEALGINNQSELSDASAVLRNRINSFWMAQGVTLLDPASTWIEPTVALSQDVWIEPGVQLKGSTRIAPGCRIGAYSILESMELDEAVEVAPFCHLKESRVGQGSDLGPFARLRPGAQLGPEVHIGNFVEVKKSELARGVKVGHLTYLGDAQVGENTNIGAGTITCNYDGFEKSVTKLGRGVFIGSNSSLVAPLNLADGVIVGAGSVVTQDAAKDSLVLERSSQVEKKGGAKKFRERRAKEKAQKKERDQPKVKMVTRSQALAKALKRKKKRI